MGFCRWSLQYCDERGCTQSAWLDCNTLTFRMLHILIKPVAPLARKWLFEQKIEKVARRSKCEICQTIIK